MTARIHPAVQEEPDDIENNTRKAIHSVTLVNRSMWLPETFWARGERAKPA
jgi:hypothetical protein